jgi:hypothetical protein
VEGEGRAGSTPPAPDGSGVLEDGWLKRWRERGRKPLHPKKKNGAERFRIVPDPTPEEIEQRAREIRQGWDELTERLRRGQTMAIIKSQGLSRRLVRCWIGQPFSPEWE